MRNVRNAYHLTDGVPQGVPSCKPHDPPELDPRHAAHANEHHDEREDRAGELAHVGNRHFLLADRVGRAADGALELGRRFRLQPLHQAVVVHCRAQMLKCQFTSRDSTAAQHSSLHTEEQAQDDNIVFTIGHGSAALAWCDEASQRGVIVVANPAHAWRQRAGRRRWPRAGSVLGRTLWCRSGPPVGRMRGHAAARRRRRCRAERTFAQVGTGRPLLLGKSLQTNTYHARVTHSRPHSCPLNTSMHSSEATRLGRVAYWDPGRPRAWPTRQARLVGLCFAAAAAPRQAHLVGLCFAAAAAQFRVTRGLRLFFLQRGKGVRRHVAADCPLRLRTAFLPTLSRLFPRRRVLVLNYQGTVNDIHDQ